jgi:hypothetical protein
MRTAGIVTLAVIVGLMSLLPPGVGPSLGNGGKSKRLVYRGTLPTSEGAGRDVQFDAELEPLLFRLTAVRERYRVVRIRLRNAGARPLALSVVGDVVEAHFRSGSAVTGLLDLGAHDAAAWAGLPAEVRNAIVYPRVVPAGEEESVFVFLPVADVGDAPVGFRYTIASRPDRPVLIRDVSAAVAH